MLIEKLRKHKELFVLIILALVALLIWSWALRPDARELTTVFLDVGQGDCIFVRTPSGRTMLVDGGGRPEDKDGDRIGMSVVEPFLRRRGINRIDMVVLSHPHDDHVQGLVSVVRDFRVGMVVDPGIPHGAQAYARFLSTIEKRRIPYRRVVRGQVIDFGDGVRVQVLHPPSELPSADDANVSSIVLRITYGQHAVLLTGDATSESEEDILSSGLNVHSDVLKVGHHGSRHSTCDDWLDAVRPRYAVISVGKGNQFGHPSPDVLRRLSERKVRVFRTDECGAVTITMSDGGMRLRRCVPMHAD